MKNTLVATVLEMIIGGVLVVAAHADEAKPSQLNTLVSGTVISGYVDVAAQYNLGQSDTLALVERAYLKHQSGIVGQVLLVIDSLHGLETSTCQTPLFISVKCGNRFPIVCQVTTAEDGTFFLKLPPGTYGITPFLQNLNFRWSDRPVEVKVKAREITLVEIGVNIPNNFAHR